MTTRQLDEKILKGIEQIPTLPIIVVKLMRLVENPKTSAKEVTQVVTLDPPLTLKILRIVNSAYYGLPKAVNTVTHAVMILGFEEVKNIALSISVMDLFKLDEGAEGGFDRVAFWQHSIAVGVCAKLLAKKARLINAEDYFVVGLLHDVGKIVLDQFFHDLFLLVFERARAERCLFINAERHLLNLDHAALGRLVSERWGLPPSIVEGIGGHHEPDGRERGASIVHVADILVRKLKLGNGGDEGLPQLRKSAWDSLKLKSDELETLYGQVRDEVERAGAFLEFSRPSRPL